MKHRESDLQKSLVRWFSYQFPEYSDLLFHIPNGGKRNAREAARFKAEGVKAGVPDLFLSVPSGPFHGFYLEVKAPGGKPTEKQKAFISKARLLGYRAEIVTSLEQFIELIKEYLTE